LVETGPHVVTATNSRARRATVPAMIRVALCIVRQAYHG
jgi:hypothetical protein